MKSKILVPIPIDNVVFVESDHGGYKSGKCLACGESGWLDGWGYNYNQKNVMGNHLKHKKDCPMNAHIPIKE